MRLQTSFSTLITALAIFACASFGLTLVTPDAGAMPGSAGVVNFVTATQTVTEGTTIELTLTRTGGSEGGFNAILVDDGGTATNDIDYRSFNNQGATWQDGETGPRTIPIIVFADGDTEGDETINIRFDVSAPGTSGLIDTADLQAGTATVQVPGALSVWIAQDERVTLKAAGAIVFEGPLPQSGTITVPWTSDTALTTLTFATRLTNGAQYSEQVTVTQSVPAKGSAPSSVSRASLVANVPTSPLAATPPSESSPPIGLAGLVLATAVAAFGVAAATRRQGIIEF